MRGGLSMYELTLGNWAPITRYLYEHISPLAGPVMIVYRTLVGEAMMRIISANFILETFRSVQSDDEIMIKTKEKQADMHAAKMTMLFEAADESGDGLLTEHEF